LNYSFYSDTFSNPITSLKYLKDNENEDNDEDDDHSTFIEEIEEEKQSVY
jgi:hypothetical protein